METSGQPEIWFREPHRDILEVGFRVEETLFSGKSPYQRVDLLRARWHGVMLLNDGIVNVSERDEFIYHEMITHVPLCLHPNPKRVLVIGGGDCGTAREALKHPSVERVVMVEIDRMVVEACRKHFDWVEATMADPRFELIIGDGVAFVKDSEPSRFDLVVVDSTDPGGPSLGLFQRPFYENVARALNENGIMITQAESAFYDAHLRIPMFEHQRPCFERLHAYLYANMTYPSGLFCFGFASKRPHPLKDFDPARVDRIAGKRRYYNAGIHRAAFMLPEFFQEEMVGILDSPD